ncbi:MAG TPA: hypothetical protein VGN34_08230, partial [Ktedonobacteraceae bacterium]
MVHDHQEHVTATPSSGLLSTKLILPRTRSSLVSRPSLLTRLNACLDYTLTFLSAPAGFGKTTLAQAWATSHHSEPLAIAWVSLDTDDNDAVRFWRYIATACQQFDATVSRSTLALFENPPSFLTMAQHLSFEAVLTTLINGLAGLSLQCILILDDYHTIVSPQIHKTVSFFLDHLPATTHVILLSRHDLPSSLAHLNAHGEALQLSTVDLRFSLEETRAFLQQTLPISPDNEIVSRLHTSSEGWVAGLKLAALTLQRHSEKEDYEDFLAILTGRFRPVQEYLVNDVLRQQPEEAQMFLLQTSGLGRLTGSLCDAVTMKHESDVLLSEIEQANLFLETLDSSGQWYRYHALFAEAMQQEARRQFGKDELRTYALRVSVWYERQGMLAEAIESALKAQDFTRTSMLIERIVEPIGVVYEYHTLRRWLEQFPEEILPAHPLVCFFYTISLLFTMDRHAVATRVRLEALLRIAENGFRAKDNRRGLGALLALRSLICWWQEDYATAFSSARESITMLPASEIQLRGMSLLNIGMEERLTGKLHAARQTITQARTLFESVNATHPMLAAILNQGHVCREQGDLHQAAQFYQQVLAVGKSSMHDDKGQALAGLALLHYEWNKLEFAEQ